MKSILRKIRGGGINKREDDFINNLPKPPNTNKNEELDEDIFKINFKSRKTIPKNNIKLIL